jgi:hypothetical protein
VSDADALERCGMVFGMIGMIHQAESTRVGPDLSGHVEEGEELNQR